MTTDQVPPSPGGDRRLPDLMRYAAHAPMGVVVVDAGGHFEWVNERFCEMTGYPPHELLGRHLTELLPDEFRGDGARHFASLRETAEHDIVGPYRTREGAARWWRVRASRIDDDRFIGFHVDVTEQREAEEALRRADDFRRLLVRLSATYLELDPSELDHALATSLREIGELLGADRAYLFSLDEAAGTATKSHEWCAPGTDPQTDRLQEVSFTPFIEVVEVLRRGEPWVGEDVWAFGDRASCDDRHHPGGRSLALAPLMDDDELLGFVGLDSVRSRREFDRDNLDLLMSFAGMVASVQRRSATEEALRESEERFRSMCDDFTHVAIQGYGPDGTTQYWNRGSELLYGYTRDEALGRNLLDLIIPDEMKEGVQGAIDEMALTGKAIPSAELSLQHRDGSRVEVYSSHWIVRRRRGDQELFCVDVDLSGVKDAEARRKALEEQLIHAQRLESVGRLAGGVAHDFNNMLNVILGFTELAIEDDEATPAIREHLDEIHRAASRSAELTSQLLAFARRQTIAPRRIALDHQIAGATRMLQRLVPESVIIDFEPGPDTPAVLMDAAQLEQALTNLVVNARDAMAGAGRVTLTTGAVQVSRDHPSLPDDVEPGRFATLVVTDDGPGMTPDVLEHIFEPFYTTKEVGRGTGLGLSTVYGTIRQHGGFVEVWSEPGAGARFTLFIPDADRRDGAGPGSGHVVAEESVAVLRCGRILLVEDEPSVLHLAARALERRGHTVTRAASPAQALERVGDGSARFDLLVTDMIMPEMNGIELATRIREKVADIGVLFMSGHAEPALRELGATLRPTQLLKKPFKLTELEQRVQEALAPR